MKDNENPVLLGGVSYDETNLPYQLEADYDDYYEDEKYLQRANVLFDYPYVKEENTFIGLGEIPNDNITINYYYPNKPIESNVRDLRKEQDIIASQAKANRVYVPEKQNNQRIDYINKPLMNNGLTYIPEKNEIEMKPKKPIKQEKNYEEIANWFYPNMPEKSQIQETKRIPLLAENNQPPVKYYDDYPTLADRNYVVKPIQESFTGGAVKIPETINTKNKEKNENVLRKNKNIKSEEDKNRDVLKSLGLDDTYEIKNNTISIKKKEKEYVIIDNVKYPINSDKKSVKILKKQAEYVFRKRRDEYLSSSVPIEQYGVDHPNNLFVRKYGYKHYGKEATENLCMSKSDYYMNTQYAREHLVLENYEKIQDINAKLKNYFKDKIVEQIGKDKLKSIKGIFIDFDSKSSQKLANYLIHDDMFIQKLKKYDKALVSKFFINDSISFNDTNWHYAIGNADIREMHINKDGDLELYICDVYDFNEFDDRKFIKIGRDRQDRFELIPYYFAYRVIISKDKIFE